MAVTTCRTAPPVSPAGLVCSSAATSVGDTTADAQGSGRCSRSAAKAIVMAGCPKVIGVSASIGMARRPGSARIGTSTAVGRQDGPATERTTFRYCIRTTAV
jgi:hypothetical protein